MTIVIIVLALLYLFASVAIGPISYRRARGKCKCSRGSYCPWNYAFENVNGGDELTHGSAAIIKGALWPLTLFIYLLIAIGHATHPKYWSGRKTNKLEKKHQIEIEAMRRQHEIEEQEARHEAEMAKLEKEKLDHLR